MLIEKPQLPDYITLLALSFSLAGMWAFLNQFGLLGWILIMLAILADAYDGFFSRKFNIKSHFGSTLDSLVDVITHLIAPVIYFYMSGFQGPIALFSYWIMIGCGIFRLSVFTSEGFLQAQPGTAKLFYRGLPVFWVPLVSVLLFEYIQARVQVAHYLLPVVLLTLSAFMIYNKPRYKPKDIKKITIFLGMIILGLFIQLIIKNTI